MTRLAAKYVAFSLLAGALWGVIGLALAGQVLGAPVWGGVVAAPAIGLGAATMFRGFRSRPPGARIALALISLYLGAGLFALAAGIVDAMHPVPDRIAWAVVVQAVLGVWWGITFTGYLPLLWPLAYLTHALLGRVDVRAAGVGK